MPLSAQQRADIINDIKTNKIGTYTGSGNVVYNNYGFSAPLKVFQWFTGLPFAFQEGILTLIAKRQGSYDTSKQWIQEEPFNYWSSGVSWGQYLKDIEAKDWGLTRNVFGKTAEAVFNPLEAQKWEQYTSGDPEVGLWDYPKTTRWNGSYGGYTGDEGLHYFLRDLLPELYCDYVNSIEPSADLSVTPIFETRQPSVIVLSIGRWEEGSKSIVMIGKDDPTQDAWTVLQNKMAKRQNRLSIPNALYNGSSKTKSILQETIEAGVIGAVTYDYSKHEWKITMPTVPRYAQSEVINYISEADAITILNTYP